MTTTTRTLRRRPVWLAPAVALAALLAAAAPSRAGLILTVGPAAATPGGTGTFDVTVSSDGGSFDVSAFSLQLSVPASSGVTFTGVTTSTAAPYLFGTYQSGPAPFSSDAFPNTQFTASDASFTPPFYTTVNAGDTFGLARVSFAVAPDAAAGSVPVSLMDLGGATSLSDVSGNALAFTSVNGTLAVSSAAPVPEPATLVLFGGIAAAGVFGYRRRQAAA